MKNTYYFSHDYNAKDDPRILEIRVQFENTRGYGLYWMIVELLASNNGSIKNNPHFIAFYAREDEAFVSQFLSKCIELELFILENDHIYSKRLIEHIDKRKQTSEKRSIAGSFGGRARDQRMKLAKAKGSHTEAEWNEMVEYFEYKCVFCDDAFETLTKDHIIPIYQGGDDSITNIQPACRSCNSKKGSESIDRRKDTLQAIGKQMLSKWLPQIKQNQAKERKGKERKRNKREKKKDTVSIPYQYPIDTPKNKFNNIESLTKEIIIEIANEYNVFESDVVRQKEYLKNYVESKGKIYKNYKSTLKNWVMRAIDDGKIKVKYKKSTNSILELIKEKERQYDANNKPSHQS